MARIDDIMLRDLLDKIQKAFEKADDAVYGQRLNRGNIMDEDRLQNKSQNWKAIEKSMRIELAGLIEFREKFEKIQSDVLKYADSHIVSITDELKRAELRRR